MGNIVAIFSQLMTIIPGLISAIQEIMASNAAHTIITAVQELLAHVTPGQPASAALSPTAVPSVSTTNSLTAQLNKTGP